MILIISTPTDPHAVAVQQALDQIGYPHFLLDTSRYPQEISLTIEQDCNRRLVTFADNSGLLLDAAEITAAWWRRPQPCAVSEEISNDAHRNFARNEAEEAISGLWYSLDIPWVNAPKNDDVANRKVHQLNVAQQLGIRLPDTCITNDPKAAQKFIDSRLPERTICKAFSATWDQWRETRIVGEMELAALENVRYAPVIFQEYIKADCDLRITAVGDKLFPAAIYIGESAYEADVRMDIGNARMEAVELPEHFTAQLLALQRRLGLVYGAIDVRLTPEGTYVFLEVNPAGQWLFIEEKTGQPIAKALAEYLVQAAKADQVSGSQAPPADIELEEMTILV